MQEVATLKDARAALERRLATGKAAAVGEEAAEIARLRREARELRATNTSLSSEVSPDPVSRGPVELGFGPCHNSALCMYQMLLLL